MKLILKGHDYKYAVEQILLMMYPDERPIYDVGADGFSAHISLTRGMIYATAVTLLVSDGNVYRGLSRVKTALLEDKLTTDRLLQKTIKLSFYKAALAEKSARSATYTAPVWGALTGIRPGKIASNLLEKGVSPQKAKHQLEADYFVSPERAALCIDTALASNKARLSLDKRDIALYIGIPFCPTRCHYCSFVSHSVEKSMKLLDPFLEALSQELDAVAEVIASQSLRVVAVYMGGGTPTTLSADQLHRLLSHLKAAVDLSQVREYTVEAGRPDTITGEKLRVLIENGADRVSINPQTMSDSVLQAIGRRHTAAQVVEAVALARRAGFPAINMDMIAGLPGDTPETFDKSLRDILSLSPENITIHTLSLKKGTKITLEGTVIPDGAAVGQMLDTAQAQLRGAGFAPYYLYRQKFMTGGFENVGWSRAGYESLYNILIMEELSTILALGGGGVTKLVRHNTGRIDRIFNLKYPYEYIDNIDRVLSQKARIVDFFSV